MNMEYATLSCGERMPLVGFGTYQLDGETERCVREALACGYRSIDTAQYYGNEADVGRAIAASGVPREDLFLTTKLQSGHDVAASVEASLQKLRTDYLDLLLIHWPMGDNLAIYHAMEALVRQGRVRALGLSNFYGRVYDEIIAHYAICPSVIQQETHLYLQNQERQKIYQRQGVTLEAWAPFGEGKENMFRLPLVEELAASYRRTPAQIILRFFVQQGIVVIPKTRHPKRMADSAKATCDYFGKHIVFVNVLRKMSVDCDCAGTTAAVPTIPDIGILASTDLMAIDQASVDLVYSRPENERHDIVERMESRHGLHQLTAMANLKLGNAQYELIDVD